MINSSEMAQEGLVLAVWALCSTSRTTAVPHVICLLAGPANRAREEAAPLTSSDMRGWNLHMFTEKGTGVWGFFLFFFLFLISKELSQAGFHRSELQLPGGQRRKPKVH